MKRGVAIGGALALAVAVAGGWSLLRDRAPVEALVGGLRWDVHNDEKKLDRPLIATATHDIDGGGQIDITASCGSGDTGSSIALDFVYFAKQDNGSGSSFEVSGSGIFERVDVTYRLDGGQIQYANGETHDANRAEVTFAETENLHDLRQLLNAHEVDFQLPLSGGGSEIVKLYPQDSGFQEFAAKCKVDLKSLDEDVAKKADADKRAQDAARAAADQKAADDAKAALEAKQRADAEALEARQQADAQAAAAQASMNAVRTACVNGHGMLRVVPSARSVTVSPPSDPSGGDGNGDRTYITLRGGQTVAPAADPDAVARGVCTVRFGADADAARGSIPLNDLQPAG